MLLSNEQILAIIPHRPPMVLIDTLIRAEEGIFASAYTVPTDSIFLHRNILSETALLENIAQTCAAGFGYLSREQEGEPKPGFIGAITRVIVSALPKVGDRILTEVSILHQMDRIVMVRGKSTCDDKQLIEAELKLVI